MKKKIKFFILGFICSIILCNFGLVFSSNQYVCGTPTYDIVINGKSMVNNAQYPILNYEGTTYLSLRDTSMAFDANLQWNEGAFQAELTTKEGIYFTTYQNCNAVEYENNIYIELRSLIESYSLDYAGYISSESDEFKIQKNDIIVTFNISDYSKCFAFNGRTYIIIDVLTGII
jgi:hypothetical protein